MIYFTSDTHFCHHNIIHLTHRPYHSYQHMENILIANWNHCVNEDDDIYILGDFIHKGDALDANRLLKQLNGKKYLIKGNHDTYVDDTRFDSSLVEWVKEYFVLEYGDIKFILFHYPILEWQGFFSKSIHLYGHVHNTNRHPHQHQRLSILNGRAFNVGVDVNHYKPVSIQSILARADPFSQ